MSARSPEQHSSKPNGMLPNSRFPLLVHRGGIAGGGSEAAVMERFRANGWLNNWRYPGIYTYPHFHSTTHECLGVATGWMEVELFGRGGLRMRVSAGDVIVMPAGVSHSMVGQSEDIMMVGGYPDGPRLGHDARGPYRRNDAPRCRQAHHDAAHSIARPGNRRADDSNGSRRRPRSMPSSTTSATVSTRSEPWGSSISSAARPT